ncbi:oligosaccharide flippase family protein [Pseudomonas sp. CNPSo 3701]|uniref:oligosaccharide flippase family protein n=1 Tax=Pseudomonas sp. CNPSo 3701 TaxID=3027943 RepID=UPI0023649945|nr:oligosaccharide flippase family protein [Pseudomonas sp. CNPSo 3701]MDD1508256.1 oligosaccharide flippase family protein [Pseudomonas sp. CNPSo 3701]
MGFKKLSDSNSRGKSYFKQLKGAFFYKIGAVASSFLAVPIMLRYLGAEQFGVWSTMLTLLSWIMIFDLGIGSGLKNKIAQSVAIGDVKAAAGYISTAYILIGCFSVIMFVLFIALSFWLPWQAIFNTRIFSESHLRLLVICLSFFVFLNFWLGLVNQIYHGLQRSSMVVLGQLISNFFALIVVVFLYKFSNSSILFMVFSHGGALFFSNLLLTRFIFSAKRQLIPSVRKFDFYKVKPLLALSLKFFVIQVSVLLIFMTDKILITQLLGPQYVMPYDVLFKLFSVFTVVHGLILAPLWPACADAYQKNDLDWIARSINYQLKFYFLIVVGVVVFAGLGPWIVKVWIGEEFSVDRSLYFIFAVFIIVSIWNNIFGVVLGAINKVRLGAIHTFLSALINVPLSIFLVRFFDLGIAGVLCSTIISILLSSLISPVQVWYFIIYRQKNILGERIFS